jgi:hypothetical protein
LIHQSRRPVAEEEAESSRETLLADQNASRRQRQRARGKPPSEAVAQAMDATELDAFPENCPWSMHQVLSAAFFPEA